MSTTINKEEIQKFSRLADEWWDVDGKFKPLHMFNPIRIEYITNMVKQHFKIDNDKANFLSGLNILLGYHPRIPNLVQDVNRRLLLLHLSFLKILFCEWFLTII